MRRNIKKKCYKIYLNSFAETTELYNANYVVPGGIGVIITTVDAGVDKVGITTTLGF